MTDEANAVNEQENQQAAMIRQSLLNSVFEQYNKLTHMVRVLPIPAEIPGIFKGLSYLEDGMLWIKEVLIVAPLLLGAQKKEESVTAEIPDEIKAE